MEGHWSLNESQFHTFRTSVIDGVYKYYLSNSNRIFNKPFSAGCEPGLLPCSYSSFSWLQRDALGDMSLALGTCGWGRLLNATPPDFGKGVIHGKERYTGLPGISSGDFCAWRITSGSAWGNGAKFLSQEEEELTQRAAQADGANGSR